MKLSSLISQIARGTWAIDPAYAKSHLPLVGNIIQGNEVAFDYKGKTYSKDYEHLSTDFMIGDVNAVETTKPQGFKDVERNSVAIIPISGPIMKDDYCGDAGTSRMALAVKQADSNPNISSIVLRIDSPGGMVSGTASLADAIKGASKPTVAIVDDGMMASAAYWIGSAADYIFSTHAINPIGSIGVFTQLADFSGAYDQAGIKIKTIYSSLSTEKNGAYRAAIDDDNDQPMIERLDFIANEFIQTVKSNRPNIKQTEAFDPFKGDAPNSLVALEHGLIDGIKSFDEAVLFASEQSTKNNSSIQNSI